MPGNKNLQRPGDGSPPGAQKRGRQGACSRHRHRPSPWQRSPRINEARTAKLWRRRDQSIPAGAQLRWLSPRRLRPLPLRASDSRSPQAKDDCSGRSAPPTLAAFNEAPDRRLIAQIPTSFPAGSEALKPPSKLLGPGTTCPRRSPLRGSSIQQTPSNPLALVDPKHGQESPPNTSVRPGGSGSWRRPHARLPRISRRPHHRQR